MTIRCRPTLTNFKPLLLTQRLLYISFNLDGNIIKCDDEVKLPGVTFDFMLNFNSHISNICKKASQQFNVLACI